MKKKNKSILIIVPTFLPHIGGIENTIFEISKGLAKRGYDVDVLTPNLWGGKNYERFEGFNVYRVHKPIKNKYLKFIIYQFYEYRKIKELIKKENKRYDLVKIVYSFPQLFISFWTKYVLKIPTIIAEHHFGTGSDICSYKENPYFVNLLAGLAMNFADMVTVSGLTQEKYVRKFAKNARYEIIGCGVDSSKFIIGEKDKEILKKYNINGPFIFSVGRLNKRKNFSDLIKSIKYLKKDFPEIKLLIAGGGEEKESLNKLIHRLDLTENVKLIGLISHSELIKCYQTADVFAFTSKFEGFGLIFCEALLCGTPVVSYDILAARDVMRGINIAFLSKQNPKNLSTKIKEVLLMNITKSDRILASEIIKKRYSWDVIIDSYADLFDRVIKK